MYNCGDAYIAVKETIFIRGTADTNKWNKNLVLKNESQFKSRISKINSHGQLSSGLIAIHRQCRRSWYFNANI